MSDARVRAIRRWFRPGFIDVRPPRSPGDVEIGSGGTDGGVSEQRYRDSVHDVTDDQVAANFNSVLLNVDWSRILSAVPEVPAPHGVEMPADVRAWLADTGRDGAAMVTRAAITSVINPRYQGVWAKHFEGRTEVLEEAMHTLGRVGGNLLAQHVALNLGRSGEPSFDTVAEITEQEPPARPVFVERGTAEHGLFDWLAGSGQPLLFATGDDSDVWSGLRRVIVHRPFEKWTPWCSISTALWWTRCPASNTHSMPHFGDTV